MDLTKILRYKGYIATPPLWFNDDIFQFKQLDFKNLNNTNNTVKFEVKNHRLGKLVEDFVYHQLQHQQNVKWITDSIQIQNHNTTIGELDALFYLDNKPIHLEIVYKFYLYDTLENYNESLSYWIGPNRNDSLLYKLNKLKTKQFPLLYNPITYRYLNNYNLNVKDINQYICFKAQLFSPYNSINFSTQSLNNDCVSGFHLSYSKIELLKAYDFYIPEKLDWLIIPHHNVNWLTYQVAIDVVYNFIVTKRSPLIWLKSKTNQLNKCFITWW